MRMKRVIWGVVIIILVVLIVAVSTQSNTEETIRIGAPIALTGKAASFGETLSRGFNMAVDEVNEKYDFNIEIVYEDTRSEVAPAVSAFRKLIEVDQVDLVVGPLRSNNVLAVAPIAEENQILVFSPIASSEDITEAGDYIFRNRETGKTHGVAASEFLFSKEIKKVALFTAQSANSKTYTDALRPDFIARGGEIVFDEEYDEESTDFRTLISKAVAVEPGAMYISAALGTDGGLLLKQIREAEFEGIVFGSVGIESQEFIDAAGVAVETIIYTSPAFSADFPETGEYLKKFKAIYSIDSDAFAANSYDAVHLIAMGIDSCGDDNSTCIKDFLYDVKDYRGAGGLTTFDKNGDVLKPVAFKTVRDGEFVVYED